MPTMNEFLEKALKDTPKLDEEFDKNAEQIHNEIEKTLKKYFGKNAKVLNAGVKAGKSRVIVTKDKKDYVVTIEKY